MTKQSSSNTTRQRRGPKPQPEEPNNNEQTSSYQPTPQAIPETADQESIESAWHVVRKHPLFWVLILLGIPYGMHLGYRWIVLQHPMNGMRAAVSLNNPRQVLILGSMSSGTSSIADELRTNFLEVGHEDSDATWKFVRDGTVSWFHGIRYFPSVDRRAKLERVAQICAVSWHITSGKVSSNYGFGPTLFGNPNYECSFWHPNFQKCYLKSCHEALLREYGCALEPEGCQTPFAATLLQTREPWKIISSLAAKYCFKDGKIDDSVYPDTLQLLLVSLGLASPSINSLAPCATQMMEYVVNYYNKILDNSNDNILVYSIEETTPCDVAELAGLANAETTLYLPNHLRYIKLCGDGENTKDVTRSSSNVINKGRVSMTDLLPFATPDRLKDIQDLYVRLGYEYPEMDTGFLTDEFRQR